MGASGITVDAVQRRESDLDDHIVRKIQAVKMRKMRLIAGGAIVVTLCAVTAPALQDCCCEPTLHFHLEAMWPGHHSFEVAPRLSPNQAIDLFYARQNNW